MFPSFILRFHNADHEPSMERAVVPSIRDDIQLSVEIYRSKLYELIASRKNRVRSHLARSSHHKYREPTDNSATIDDGTNHSYTSSTANTSHENINASSSNANMNTRKNKNLNGSRNGMIVSHGHARNDRVTTSYCSHQNPNYDPDDSIQNKAIGGCKSKNIRVRSNSVSTPLHRSRSELRDSKSGSALSSSVNSHSFANENENANSSFCEANVSPVRITRNTSPPRISFTDNNKNRTHTSPPLQEARGLHNGSSNGSLDEAIKVKVVARRIDNARNSTSTIFIEGNNQNKESRMRLSPDKLTLDKHERPATECLSGTSTSSCSSNGSHGTRRPGTGPYKRYTSPGGRRDGNYSYE